MSGTAKLRSDFARLRAASGETRSPDRLAAHYALEVSLAGRLKASRPGERAQTYAAVYEALFAGVPDHPQHAPRTDLRRSRLLQQAAFLRRYLHAQSTYVEIGCGDAALAKLIAPSVRSAIGVDVTAALVDGDAPPAGFSFVRTDGVALDLPDGTADVAYSNQLMEHLHPDDAGAQLAEVLRILKPGGQYICTTPNRLTGPHDISRYFSHEPQGFHLREYTHSSLAKLFRAAGFRAVSPVILVKGRACAPPLGAVAAVEWGLERLPAKLLAAVMGRSAAVNLAGVTLVGWK